MGGGDGVQLRIPECLHHRFDSPLLRRGAAMVQLRPSHVLRGVGTKRDAPSLPLLLRAGILTLAVTLGARAPATLIAAPEPARRKLAERVRLASACLLLVNVTGSADKADPPPSARVS